MVHGICLKIIYKFMSDKASYSSSSFVSLKAEHK